MCDCHTHKLIYSEGVNPSSNQSWSYDNQSDWNTYPNFYNVLRTPLNIKTNRLISGNNKLKMFYSHNQRTVCEVDPNFTIYVLSDSNSYIIYNDVKYTLIQFHFHNASENLIDNVFSPVECHLVHENVETHELVIIGLLMSKSKHGSDLTKNIVSNVGKEVYFNLAQYNKLYKNKYYSFMGSLTTPPFDVGERWLLFDSNDIKNNINITISHEEWMEYAKTFANNRSNTVNQFNDSRFTGDLCQNDFSVMQIN